MRNLPVHWAEGMFLRPQHFQSADRHWTEMLTISGQWDNPYNYGLRGIEISKEAIANYQVQVSACAARMKDGSIVSLETGQEPDRVNLKDAVNELTKMVAGLTEAFEKEPVVRVYLATPKLKMGRANVAAGGESGDFRYQSARLAVQDESRGGNDQEIELRSLNVRLLLSTQDLSGYELLPIAQIKRASEGEATPILDEDYIPPVLAIEAWPPLGRGYVRAIYDIIGQKIEVLSQQVLSPGITLASSEPGDLERIQMLSVLNEAYSTLHILTFATGVHPFIAYTELCRLVGKLAVFDKQRRAPEIPQYDHEDLARIFKWVKRRIEDAIHTVRDFQYEQRYFIGAGRGMQVSLEPKWFNSDWDWYVGVNRGNLTEKECRELLSVGHLDWKMGSSAMVDILFRNRAPGVQLVPLTSAPRALPSGGGWIYYEVSRDGPAFKNVMETTSLAMRFKEELIRNLDDLQGERNLVVSTGGKPATLQFALFAVPTLT